LQKEKFFWNYADAVKSLNKAFSGPQPGGAAGLKFFAPSENMSWA